MTKDIFGDAIDTAAALVCVELAFVLPPGTDMRTHPLALAIVNLVKVVRASKEKE